MTRPARMRERFIDSAVMRETAVSATAFASESRVRSGSGRILRACYEHLVFYALLVIFAISSLIWSLAAVILALFLPRRISQPLGQFLIMVGFRYFIWLMQRSGIFRCDLTALDGLRDQAPLIIAPNHPTLLDVMLVISRLPRVVCTVKAERLKNLFIGASARLAGYLRNDSPTRLVREGIRQLRDGRQLLIFPEGTRTRGNSVDPFKGGFALMAKHADVPVQTLFIESNSRFLRKGWSLLRKPDFPLVYRVRLGPALAVEGDFREFVLALHRFYRRELDGSDP